MNSSMEQLKQDIRNQVFKRCYLLCGDETYLRLQFKDNLINALIPEGDTMNFNKFSGKEVNVNEIIDQAETMPFFGERRTILIENSGLCSKGGEKLADYLAESAEFTVIVMVEAEVEKSSKLYKAFAANGMICDFETQNDNTLMVWIKTRVKQEGKNIDNNAIGLLLERTGTDMMTISNELEKLFSYTMVRSTITAADVDMITTVSTTSKVFDMITVMAERKPDKALEMYHELLDHKESPMGLLNLIIRQFNLILQVKELRARGIPSSKAAEMMKVASFVERKCENQARGFSLERLRNALEACIRAEEDVKYRSMDPALSVELLILEYSR